MDLSWLQSLILGLISGAAEFLPISAEAHRKMISTVLNISMDDALLKLMLHAASLAALLWFCRRELHHLQEERRIQKSRSRNQKLHSVPQRRVMLQLWKSAVIPIVVCFFLLRRYDFTGQLHTLALLLVANGLILFLPPLFPHGNKDGRNIAPMDGFLMSLGAGLGFFPGLSRVGASLSLGILAGVDKAYALRLSMLLWIPCLVILVIVDLIAGFSAGLALSFAALPRYLLAGVAAFLGSLFSLRLLRFLSVRAGFSGFCFYSWALALVSFILYIII